MGHVPSDTRESIAYQHLLDEVGSFVYTTDLEGRYTYANQLVLQLLGSDLTLPDVLGKSFTDFVDIGEAGDSLRKTDRHVLEQGITIAREETNYIHASSEWRTYWSIKKPLRDSTGTIIGMIGISHDITEKKRLEEKVHKQNELLDSILENVQALVYMKSADRRFLYGNRHLATVFGKPIEDIIGHLDSDLMPQDVADAFWEKDLRILETGERYAGEESLIDAQGQQRHYWSVVTPWTGFDGKPALIGLVTDITELHTLKEQLRQQAQTDALTGVANRRYFMERAEQEFARSRRQGHSLSLITFDVDLFKQVNDRYGHITGDNVLQQLSQCCQSTLRESDLLARTGGEEFCILLPETHLTEACATAERLRTLCECSTLAANHPELRVSTSLGVACMNEQDTTFQSLFARADRALYVAKDQGRNRIAVLS